MARPIPRSWLFHTATLLKNPIKDDMSMEIGWEIEIPLKFVRIEISRRTILEIRNAERRTRNRLFYDCRISLPRGVDFVQGDGLLWEGKVYHVERPRKYPDERGWHHWEVDLQ